jgi:hypothetical protein
LRQWRLPFDAGVRVRLGGTRIASFAELGLCAALLSEQGLDLVTPREASAVEVGLRGALGAHLVGSGRLVPFAALQAALIPAPPAVFALPRGEVGTTPHVWIGATAGASVGFP